MFLIEKVNETKNLTDFFFDKIDWIFFPPKTIELYVIIFDEVGVT